MAETADGTTSEMGPDQDPADYNMADVTAYLEGVEDPGERERVRSLEAAGQDRKGIAALFQEPDVKPGVGVGVDADDAVDMGYQVVDVSEQANNPPVTEV